MSKDNNLREPFEAYLREHVREHQGLPYWCLALGLEGVAEKMGWEPPRKTSDANTILRNRYLKGHPWRILRVRVVVWYSRLMSWAAWPRNS
jgi:hypothetical protein